jgi:hypothetical protein
MKFQFTFSRGKKDVATVLGCKVTFGTSGKTAKRVAEAKQLRNLLGKLTRYEVKVDHAQRLTISSPVQ